MFTLACLQTVEYLDDDEIRYLNSYKDVAPEALIDFFVTPSPLTFSFYRNPGSGAVLLIWMRFPLATSTKRTRGQHRIRRELVSIAEMEGIKDVCSVSHFCGVFEHSEATI